MLYIYTHMLARNSSKSTPLCIYACPLSAINKDILMHFPKSYQGSCTVKMEKLAFTLKNFTPLRTKLQLPTLNFAQIKKQLPAD